MTNESLVEDIQKDRRDLLLGYIRNAQRLREQKSKITGINTWVLIGACSLFAWNISKYDYDLFNFDNFQILIIAICLSLFVEMLFSTSLDQSGAKFVRLEANRWPPELQISLVRFSNIFWVTTPLALYGFTVSRVSIPTFLAIVTIAVVATELTREGKQGVGRFPYPSFKDKTPPEHQRYGAIFFFLLAGVQIFIDGKTILEKLPSMNSEQIQILLLAFGMYWTVGKLFENQALALRDTWLDTLESNLVLGIVSTQDAQAELESRALGKNFVRLISEAWIDYRVATKELDRLTDELETLKDEIADIPTEFHHERTGRVNTKLEKCDEQVKKAVAILKEIIAFTALASTEAKNARIEIKDAISRLNDQCKEASNDLAKSREKIAHARKLNPVVTS